MMDRFDPRINRWNNRVKDMGEARPRAGCTEKVKVAI